MPKTLTVEFPDPAVQGSTEDIIEKVRDEFWEKVALPFNEFFANLGSMFEFFDCDFDSILDEPGAIGMCALHSPFSSFIEENDGLEHVACFYIDGHADFSNECPKPTDTIVGTWEEIMSKMFDFIKEILFKLNDTTRKIDNLSEAIKILSQTDKKH